MPAANIRLQQSSDELVSEEGVEWLVFKEDEKRCLVGDNDGEEIKDVDDDDVLNDDGFCLNK